MYQGSGQWPVKGSRSGSSIMPALSSAMEKGQIRLWTSMVEVLYVCIISFCFMNLPITMTIRRSIAGPLTKVLNLLKYIKPSIRQI